MIRSAIAEALLDNASELLPSHFVIPSLTDQPSGETLGLRAATVEARTHLIEQALARNGHNVTQTAMELKMSREGLSRLMSSLGIRKPGK
jgi:DNA-binding NtrC family response regulator